MRKTFVGIWVGRSLAVAALSLLLAGADDAVAGKRTTKTFTGANDNRNHGVTESRQAQHRARRCDGAVERHRVAYVLHLPGRGFAR